MQNEMMAKSLVLHPREIDTLSGDATLSKLFDLLSESKNLSFR